ncbi:complement factor H-related protein 1-like [Anomaloglossus baeobatrachus]|uniref:complement factor H-related protein 1-like n=1 Tax=Anomaloglossus baeobatrachus TaxID=238106 RepID=UPI003F4F7239
MVDLLQESGSVAGQHNQRLPQDVMELQMEDGEEVRMTGISVPTRRPRRSETLLKWSQDGKKCDEPDIKNGYIHGYKWFPKFPGSTIEYRCDQNYLTPQKKYWETIKCTSNGWSSEPKCLRRCSIMKTFFDNAKYGPLTSAVFLEGEEIKFDCLPNFHTPDSQSSGIRTCLPDGEFTAAKCSKSCTTPQLLNGKYTLLKNTFVNGEYLQYECDKGYMTVRGKLLATAQCLDGEWSKIPRCIAITCKHGSSVYKDKDVISYTCPDGKRPKYNLVQCFNYGWGPPIICEDLKPDQPDAIIPPPDNEEKEEKRQKCPLVHNPRYAEIIDLKETYYSKDEVTMKCTRGYRMYGSATIRCMEGKWEQPPECYEIGNRCGPPPTIQFGDSIEIRKFSYEPGEFVEYQCPSYHVVKGEKIVRCLNSVWGEVPICLEPCTAKENSMDENNIQPKVLGEKKIYLTHGDEIEFDCIFGYEALPNTQMKITCEHGKLEYPICLRKGFCILQQSTMLANNVHYNISTVVERGQTITFQCTKDMVPEKGLEATCKLGILQYPKCTAAKSSV